MPRFSGALDIAQTGTPSTPASGRSVLYTQSDGKIYLKNPAGTVYDLTNGGVTSVATRTGAVTLTAADIGAGTFPSGTFAFNGATQFAASSTTGPISVVYNGATADNNNYGAVGITGPASVNTAYYSMTASGTAIAGIGFGSDNIMRVGTVNSGKTMSANAISIDSAGSVIAPGSITAKAVTQHFFGTQGALWNDGTATQLSANVRWDGTNFRYIATSGSNATMALLTNGAFQVYNLGAATAGAIVGTSTTVFSANSLGNVNATGIITGTAHSSTGLTGAVNGSRFVGGTASGAPSTGTFITGDFVVAANGHVWICSAGGSPGTWVDASAGGGAVTSVASRTGAVTLTAADIGAGTFPAGTFTFPSDLRAANSFLAIASGAGYTQVKVGDATHTGSVNFYAANDNRQGWIGFSTTTGATDTGTIEYVAAQHNIRSTSGAVPTIQMSADGTGGRGPELALLDTKAGQTTPNKYIRSFQGQLQFINSGYTATIAALDDAGALSVGALTASSTTTAVRYGGTGSLISLSGVASVSNNATFDGTNWKAINTGASAAMTIGGTGNYTFYNGASVTAGSTATMTAVAVISPTGDFTSTTSRPLGLTGATAATRYVGGTASGAPSTGTFSTGDWVIAQNGHIWVCTAGASPGTWVDAGAYGGGGGGASLSVANTWTAGQTFQTSDGSQPLFVKARLTGSGGQSGPLATFAAADGTTYLTIDASANLTSVGTGKFKTGIIGVGGSTYGSLLFEKYTSATSGATTRDSSTTSFRTAYWNGSVSVDEDLTLQANRASTTAADVDLTLNTGRFKAPAFVATGLTGSTASGRWVGTTVTGPPTTGAHLLGDFVNSQDGNFYTCTAAGTPGSWMVSTGSGAAGPAGPQGGTELAAVEVSAGYTVTVKDGTTYTDIPGGSFTIPAGQAFDLEMMAYLTVRLDTGASIGDARVDLRVVDSAVTQVYASDSHRFYWLTVVTAGTQAWNNRLMFCKKRFAAQASPLTLKLQTMCTANLSSTVTFTATNALAQPLQMIATAR